MATLHHDLGNLQAAEDAAQDAAEIALRRWLDDGIPDRPGAWMTTVARRRAVDRIRRDRIGREKSDAAARLDRTDPMTVDVPDDRLDGSVLRDEQLQLFFGCCHPALNVESQVALTLRSLGGLTTAEIARAFRVTEATMAQRLVRAKRKIATAQIPFRIPADPELLARLGAVRQVLYLIFNEGAYTSSGSVPIRFDLCVESIRLTRLLADLMPDDAETTGLLALVLAIDARRPARIAKDGRLVLLEAQDRALWNHDTINTAGVLVERALRLGRPGPFQIEAAIQVLHGEAATAADTDWPQIVVLYDRLLAHRADATVKLNRAVAVGMATGPQAGLVLLDELAETGELASVHYFHAARAELLTRAGAAPEPISAALDLALELVTNDAERELLEHRRARLAEPPDQTVTNGSSGLEMPKP
ncbi:MAG: sigma-70 family RNA polymerase sigma factor [Actinomycetota bacterium]